VDSRKQEKNGGEEKIHLLSAHGEGREGRRESYIFLHAAGRVQWRIRRKKKGTSFLYNRLPTAEMKKGRKVKCDPFCSEEEEKKKEETKPRSRRRRVRRDSPIKKKKKEGGKVGGGREEGEGGADEPEHQRRGKEKNVNRAPGSQQLLFTLDR